MSRRGWTTSPTCSNIRLSRTRARLPCAACDRSAVGDEQVVELELIREPGVRLLETALRVLRVVHEVVRDEAEVLLVADHPVGDRERGHPGGVEGGLVRIAPTSYAVTAPAAN